MINNNTTLRVSGLASGMNTDEIVANLVKVQSSRLNKMQQSKIQTTWKSDAYREVNKKVVDFRKTMEDLRLQTTFNKLTVSSSDPKVEVTTDSKGTQTNFEISGVTLAIAAKPAMVSFASNSASPGDMSFKLNNQDGSISQIINLTSTMSFDDAIAEINKFSETTNVKANNVGGSLVLTSTDMSKSFSISGTTPGNSLNISDSTG